MLMELGLLVLNATFKNISLYVVVSFIDEGENHRSAASHEQTIT